MKFLKELLVLLTTAIIFLVIPLVVFAAEGDILFFDDFNDGNLNGWTIESGNWYINNGNLVGSNSGRAFGGRINTSNSEWDNYRLELDVNGFQGIDQGVGVRYTANGSYEVNLRYGTGEYGTPQVKLWKKNGNDYILLADTNSVPLINNNWYRLRIEAFNENIKVWIDDTPIFDFTDTGTNIKKGTLTLSYSSGDIGVAYMRFDNVKVTALTPASYPPAPFLDLPWDYQGKGLSFNEAAQAINSYFDHEYPLLSSGLGEPNAAIGTTTTFKGEFRTKFEYSSHDGYDYGIPARVNIGDPVLAAADGIATLGDKTKCGACGNYILIDHGNGYQTRYYHLLSGSPIVTQLGQTIQVKKGQQIGKVGATGNVSPPGDAGAHIHFMVVQDKNKDGNFDDNIPDGVTDPFGWQSKDADPWENYTFFYTGQNRTGNKSYYLWTKKLDNLDSTLTSNGGVLKTSRATLNFPPGATNQNLTVNIQSSPIVQIGNTLSSIGSTIIATAQDALGNAVTQFQELFTLTIDFSSFDLSRYKQDTISIYSNQDGINWNKEPTSVDMSQKIATAQVDHFTQFALMAERADTTAPTTTANLSGTQGHVNWFRSDAQVALSTQDNEGGLGVDYTLYRINNGELQQYTSPLSFSNEGHQKLEFYSVDKDENAENIKSVEFDIDKTPPESRIRFDQNIPDLSLTGKDNSGPTRITKQNIQDKQQFIINDRAGNTSILTAGGIEHGQNAKINLESLKYNNQPEIKLDNNQFSIEDNLQADQADLRTLKQEFDINSQPSIKLEYSAQTNKTVITITHNGQIIQQKETDGMPLLKLNTEKGTLKYNYSI